MTVPLELEVKRAYRSVWGYFMNEYSRSLDMAVSQDCRTLLDIGCGACSPLRQIAARMERSVGVDAYAPALTMSQAEGVHSEHVCADASELPKHFAPASFDCVAATDLIEHLDKADGWRLLNDMEKIARKKVIVFTPNGFLPQSAYGGNEFQIHRSGWTVAEMQDRGYKVIGINGWKPLRGERSLIRFRPRLFWEPLSFLTQPIVSSRPQFAFQLLCVKTIQNS